MLGQIVVAPPRESDLDRILRYRADRAQRALDLKFGSDIPIISMGHGRAQEKPEMIAQRRGESWRADVRNRVECRIPRIARYFRWVRT